MAERLSYTKTHEEILADCQRVRKPATLWNLAASLINALTSVALLFILTRATSVEVAGIFSIAYANANLWLNLGKWGMRSYQVSDWAQRFSFNEYWVSRLFSTLIMIAMGLLWLWFTAYTNSYTDYKIAVVAVMLVFKAVDAVEDVYHARYQQQGRLDVAAMLLTLRLGSTLVLLATLVAITGDLLMPLVVSTIYTAVFLVISVLVLAAKKPYGRRSGSVRMRNVFDLLWDSAPLAAELFLTFYLTNASKYAIDGMMNDAAQAMFNFISMPVFVVALLASTIFNPLIVEFTAHYNEGRRAPFMALCKRQILTILGITVVCDAAIALLGVPVLGWLFNTNLDAYWLNMIVLMTGGGFTALSFFLTNIIAVMRVQKWLLVGYTPAALFALVAAGPFVEMWGLDGASWVYFISVLIPAVLFCIISIMLLRKPFPKENDD